MEWRPVIGYEGIYDVSDEGQVRSLARTKAHWRGGVARVDGRIKSQAAVGDMRYGGYLGVSLAKNGVSRMRLVHRVVAQAFLGLTPALQVNHINGAKTDNRLCNLEVVTSAQNIAHAIRTGLKNQTGEHNIKARLAASDIIAIRGRIAAGESTWAIARDYHVQPPCIQKIGRRATWKHVA